MQVRKNTYSVISGERGKQAAANFVSGTAKRDTPGPLSRKKPAADFRKAPTLLGRRGYEFYCLCFGQKKSPVAAASGVQVPSSF
jgi:hypothetical protein